MMGMTVGEIEMKRALCRRRGMIRGEEEIRKEGREEGVGSGFEHSFNGGSSSNQTLSSMFG